MKRWNAKDIRALRKKLKLSQTSFAECLGVTRNYIYYLEKLERREKEPSKTLRLLLDCVEENFKRKESD
jgi:DNA-binding transcriptional regulator YiaG